MTFDPNFILLTMTRQSQTFLCIDKNQGLTKYTQFSNLKVKFISKNHCVSYPVTFSLRLKKKSSRAVLYISRKYNKHVWCVLLIVQNRLSNRLTNLSLLRELKNNEHVQDEALRGNWQNWVSENVQKPSGTKTNSLHRRINEPC